MSDTTAGQNATVTLPVYRWHRLLRELEDHLSICNRDQRVAIELYQDIATQLGDRPVKFIHEQNPDPQFRPVRPQPIAPLTEKGAQRPWYLRIMSWK